MKLPLKKYLPNCYLLGLIVLAFLIRINFFIRQKDDPLQLDIFNLLQIAITLILGFILLSKKDSRLTSPLLINSPLGWLILLYFWGAISGIWSSMPMFSAYFGIEGLIYILALSVIMYNQTSNNSLESFAIYSSYLLIFLVLAGTIRLSGFSFSLYHWHTNVYTTIAAMLFGYCFGEYNNRYRVLRSDESKLLKNGIWISLFFVVIGTSSGSNLSLIAAVLVVTLISGRRSLKIFSILLFGLILLIDQIYGDLIFNAMFPGKSVEGVTTMHGRLNLWEHYFDMIRQKPWTGWGFASIERISKIYATNTHNSLIEVAGGVGIIGLILFVLYIIRAYYRFLTNRQLPYIVGVIGAITAGLVNSNSVSFIGSPTSGIFIAFIIWNLLGWYSLTGINSVEVYGSGTSSDTA